MYRARTRARKPKNRPFEAQGKPEGRPLQAKEESKDKKTSYAETCSDQILRALDLPAAAEAAKVKATLKDGILELDMAKAAPDNPESPDRKCRPV